MLRYFLTFCILFVSIAGLMWASLGNYNADTTILGAWQLWLAAVMSALYLTWRLQGMIQKFIDRGDVQLGKGLTDMFTSKPSSNMQARQARIAARREELGMAPDAQPEKPVARRNQTENISDRMAARRARVEQARRDGKLD